MAAKPPGRRLRRGTKTADYLAALSGEDITSSDDGTDKDNNNDNGATSHASTSKLSSSLSAMSLSSIDSPFQVQEYLAMLVAENPHDIAKLIEIPRLTSSTSSSNANAVASDSSSNNSNDTMQGKGSPNKGKGAELPSEKDASIATQKDEDADADNEYVDRNVWLYEHLRRIAIDLSQPFVTTLQEHCTRETCPEMKAGEWLYLCAAHPTANEMECCAIDYITHTLDGATSLLNSSRYFPSRINIPPTSLQHFSSISRRLYRIFTHAWYHHRDIFDMCEASTSLYERFLALSLEHDLVPQDLLVIPSQRLSDTPEDEEAEEAENAHARDIGGLGGGRYGTTIRSQHGAAAVAARAEQDAREEAEQVQIQKRILEKRMPGHAVGPNSAINVGQVGTSASTGGEANGFASSGSSVREHEIRLGKIIGDDDDDEDGDSSDDSSDDENLRLAP